MSIVVLAGCSNMNEPDKNERMEVSREKIVSIHMRLFERGFRNDMKNALERESWDDKKATTSSIDLKSEEEIYVFNKEWRCGFTRGNKTEISIDWLPDYLRAGLIESISNENYETLQNEVIEITQSEWFASLTEEQQNELSIDLELISEIRDTIYDNVLVSEELTRSSPGDRMIWSDIMSRLNNEQRVRLAKATLAGLSLVTGGAVAFILTLFTI